MKALLGNNRGVTLVEGIVSVMILAFAIMGLVSAFIYGRFNVERAGLERRAVEILQGELEYWKSVRASKESSELLTATSPEGNVKEVILDKEKNLKARMSTIVSLLRKDGALSYQKVQVTITYDNGHIKDSLGLATKMYLR